MTNAPAARNAYDVTPDDLELAVATDLVVGDVIVHFTPLYKQVITPATQRQLNAARCRYRLVEKFEIVQLPSGAGDGVQLNDGPIANPESGSLGVTYYRTWRIKHSHRRPSVP